MSLSLVINSLIAIIGILNSKKSKNKLNVKIKEKRFSTFINSYFFVFKKFKHYIFILWDYNYFLFHEN